MENKNYLVTREHTSEYPEPITFKKDALLSVGEKYDGPEGWSDWFFCDTPGQKGGWVPAQVIELTGDSSGRAREDYTAREMDVKEGDLVCGSRMLNGWLWCENLDGSGSGWVPLENLEPV